LTNFVYTNSSTLEHVILSLSDSVAKINLSGAELSSFKHNKLEYIWQANPAVWSRHAPILFPIVGKLRDNRYTFLGKPYSMGQHGFARDREFLILSQSESSVSLILRADESTKAVYPFDFELVVSYTMKPLGITVSYEVQNIQPVGSMLFSIGAHPGFIIPLEAGETFQDYEINFHDSDFQLVYLYPLVDGYVSMDRHSLPIKNGILGLREELFENDALIMDVHPSAMISVRSKKTGKGIGMRYADFRWLGIWMKEPGSGFICIEPWNGIADTVEHDQKLETKWGIMSLEAGERYKVNHDIVFF
jgi:galactose mutarotase-like enzyme